MVVPSGPGDRNGLHKDNLLMSISIYLIIYLHFLMIVSRGDQNGLRKDTHLFVFFFLFVFWIAYARENVCPSQLSICADHGKPMCFCNTVNSLYALYCAVLLSKIECTVECNCLNHPWPMASACSMPDPKMPHHAHVYSSSCTSCLFFFICLLIKPNAEISCLTSRASTK